MVLALCWGLAFETIIWELGPIVLNHIWELGASILNIVWDLGPYIFNITLELGRPISNVIWEMCPSLYVIWAIHFEILSGSWAHRF